MRIGRPLQTAPPRRQILALGVSAFALSCAIATTARAGPAPFSAGWYALKAASGPAASAAIANAAAGAGISGRSYAQVRQSLANLQHSAQAIASMQALQSQAHAIVAASVPNGLQIGGLVPDTGLSAPGIANPVTTWVGAAAPVQTGTPAAPTVTIRQTAPSALLNWRTLDVGARTRLAFDQSAGGAASPTWVALNRVNDPNLAPTRILGAVSAQGHVIVVNGSGVIFAPTAQVTVGSLIASTAAISDGQFAANGIYSPSATMPSFTGARAPVVVQAGAQIATTAPLTATNAGGGVILLGSDVANHGEIQTPDGQAVLGAGRDFILQQGYSVAPLSGSATNFGVPATIGGQTYETVRGTAIAVAAGGGHALNDGLIVSARGDITEVGESVTQAGVALSTTTVATRGSIHLLTDQSDPASSVTLAPGSVTTILPDPASNTALDAQRATDIANAAVADQIRSQGQDVVLLNDQPVLPDNQVQSLIQVVSGNAVDIGAGALALSEGGQIEIAAGGRVLVRSGAQLDVSGAVGVSLPMSANNVSIDVQGFELRDNPLNRDTTRLNNATVFLDTRALVTVPASTASQNSPYATTSRTYTQGGLLEVGGQIGDIAHGIGEWNAAGGTILIAGGAGSAVVAEPGSVFNLAGGSIDYRAGALRLTWLIGPGGRLYDAQTAPSDLVYSGIYDGISFSHPRWGINATYDDPLIAPSSVELPGYTVGRDGGTLEISMPTAALAGTIDAGVIDGPFQSQARGASIADPYLQPQAAVPLPGRLVIGQTGGLVSGQPGIAGGFDSAVTLSAGGAGAVPTPGTVSLDTNALDAEGLGGLSITTTRSIDVTSPLTLADAAAVTLTAPSIEVGAPIAARGGSVQLGNELTTISNAATGATQGVALIPPPPAGAVSPAAAGVTVAPGVAIDVRGVFTNTLVDPTAIAGEAAANGGTVTIDTTGGITLAAGSVIDASSGAVLAPSGNLASATGGSVTLIGDDPVGNPAGATGTSTEPVVLAGTIRSLGLSGGGSFTLRSPGVLVTADGTAPVGDLSANGRTVLTPSSFRQGFTSYIVDGYGNLPATGPSAAPAPGVEIAAGVAVDPVVPVRLASAGTLAARSGSDPGTALATYLPPLFVQNQTGAVLTPRAGASLSLQSRLFGPTAGDMSIDGGGSVLIDRGASIAVDPASNVSIEALGQITIDGSITAPGGAISVQNDVFEPGPTSGTLEYQPSLSIWIGEAARLDVAGLAETAADGFGRTYGTASGGGSITLGGPIGPASLGYAESTDAFVVIRPGAVLDASGSAAVIDLAAGPAPAAPSDRVTIAGAGGGIMLDSTSGIVIDGSLRAAAGAPTAAGGSLTVDLVTPRYRDLTLAAHPYAIPAAVEVEREIVVGEHQGPSPLGPDTAPGKDSLNGLYGTAGLSADQVAAGGFANLTLASDDFAGFGPADVRFTGNVSLAMSGSIALPGVLSDSALTGHVSLKAPSVTFNGNAALAQFTLSGADVIQNVVPSALTSTITPSTATTATTLSVRAGVLTLNDGELAGLDLANATPPTMSTPAASTLFDRPGFGDLSLSSTGDTRLGGLFVAGGDLSIISAQIYPTGAGTIELGVDGGSASTNPLEQPHTLTLARTPGTDPAPPLSVGGSISLQAATIEQGGVLRAPLGQITLGFTSSPIVTGATDQVDLLAGSITSVSLAGQTILYGGTADGVNYGLGGSLSATPAGFAPSITLQAQSVAVGAGATLDLRGGGTLAGAAFNSGRGGSTDVLTAPLLRIAGGIIQPAAGDQVYAIVPGYGGTTQAAPVTAFAYAAPADATPPLGEQLTLAAGAPGLAAGSYTLQPAYDALLPGAFRVELQPSVHPQTLASASLGDLLVSASGTLGIAGTSVRSMQPIGVLLTPGDAVRRLSSYDEEGYAAFAAQEARLSGVPPGIVPADADTLVLSYMLTSPAAPIARPALSVDAAALFAAGPGGFGGTVEVEAADPGSGISSIDIVGDAAPAALDVPAGATTVSLRASDLDRLGPETLVIGGAAILPTAATTGADANLIVLNATSGRSGPVALRTGAVLSAPQVFLLSQTSVAIDSGAAIDTLGLATPAFGAAQDYRYSNATQTSAGSFGPASVVVSNAILSLAPPASGSSGSVTIGDGALLAGEGTVAVDTAGVVGIGERAILAGRDLSFGVSSINVVPATGLPAGAAAPAGVTLSQGLLNGLFAGGIVPGAPALQQIELTASNSLNLFGTVDFTLGGAGGPQTLQIDTPSIYGLGAAGDVATITAGTVVWNGIAVSGGSLINQNSVPAYMSAPAGPVLSNGPGTGEGGLVIDAGRIVLGYASGQLPLTPAPEGGAPSLTRTTYGFGSVDLAASRQIVANDAGSLSVYRSQGAYANGGFTGIGGDLTISSPSLTAAAGAVLQVTAGGRIVLTNPGGAPAPSGPGGLGGEIDLSGSAVSIATAIGLPEGKLSLAASGPIALGAGAAIDLAGVRTAFFDQTVAGPGGTLLAESSGGGITADAASTIDVSSPGDAGGRISITAPAGAVSLAGVITGGGSTGGAIDIRAGTLTDFSGLNRRLTAGGVTGRRTFEIGAGNLRIMSADQVRASDIAISLDTGSLIVDGLVDASGDAAGTISLSAGANLMLTGNAVLDAHGNVRQTDSTGATIDAENTGSVTLRVADGPNGTNLAAMQANGTLTIASGAAIDVAAPAGVSCALGFCGQIEIDVPRIGSADGTTGDLAIAAPSVAITGAGSVAVNGFWSYAPPDGIVTQVNTGAAADPNGIGLDQIDAANRAFIASAIPNGALGPALAAKLAGLAANPGFHLRPGVEIDSSTASGGNLTVQGDLDLSGLRYASLDPAHQQTATYGSGEPGVLVLRASNILGVYGSITDGFDRPVDNAANQNPDDNGWVLPASTASALDQNVYIPPGSDPVDIGGSTYPASAPPLNYALPVAGFQTLVSGTVLPTSVTLASPAAVPAGQGVVAQGDVTAPDAVTVLYARGTLIPGGTTIPAGASLGAGFTLFRNTTIAGTNALTGQGELWPAGASLSGFLGGSVALAASVPLATGDLIPAGTNLAFANGSQSINLRQPTTLPSGPPGQGQIYGASNLLAPGSLSWSIGLVAGANGAAADPTEVTPASVLAAQGSPGTLVLSDLHYSMLTDIFGPVMLPAFSVVRTGTGSLGLHAGGSIEAASSYGIYTAGTQSPNVPAAYDQHGSFETNDSTLTNAPEAAVYAAVDASYPQGGGNVTVAAQQDLATNTLAYLTTSQQTLSATGAWLQRQGDGTASNPGAWSINFGTYVPVANQGFNGTTTGEPVLVGFAGIGTLGGGNLTVTAGRTAGVTAGSLTIPETASVPDNASDSITYLYDGGLDLAVAGTGRVTPSGTVLTGGGRLTLSVGGTLDPFGNIIATSYVSGLESTIVDLRGTVAIDAQRIGSVNASVGLASAVNNPYSASPTAGPDLILGDATARIAARGDLSLGLAGDAAREPTFITGPGATTSWFSLWNASTAIDLYSAGGDVSPATDLAQLGTSFYPPVLNVVAASGSIYTLAPPAVSPIALETAPSAIGQVQFLAANSIVDGTGSDSTGGIVPGLVIDISGADPALLPTAATPAFAGNSPLATVPGNSAAAIGSLFAFSTDTPAGFIHANDPEPARFYAASGDIENFSTGQILGTQYIAGKAVRIEAGNDVVSLDHAPGSGLFFNTSPNDVSIVSAGRDIFYANAQVAGPGLLEISAGGNIDQTAVQGANILTSLGYVVDRTVATQDAGAGITVTAGVTPTNIDLTGFADLYFDPANLADPAIPLQNQPGRVERTYQDQLLAFLRQRTGYAGSQAGALAAYQALPADIRQILALQVYYQELDRSGLDYNDPASRFFRSYSEGTEAIRALFPSTDTTGQSAAAGGSLTLTGGSGISTQFGGAIQIVDPFGATTVGVPGPVPPSTAGVITQGTGDVDIYSYGSVLLGQSRIFTTFGGNLLIWLQGNGEINGGQGSSSTIVFTPANITYDDLGDIALAPTVPATGAGLATLAPVTGVAAGNIDLVSPFGTIDAGEAGIRASGNVNLVALTILNAANVQAGGKVSGVPVAAVPNVAAITAASAASGAAQNAAANNLKPAASQKTPSIITVDILGSGQSATPAVDERHRKHKT